MLPFLRGLHNPLPHDLTAEVPLVEVLAKNGFVYQLEFDQSELVRQQFESNIRIIQLVPNALMRVLDDLAMIER